MVQKISEKKKVYMSRMSEMLTSYQRLIFCGVDNVQSQQMHNIRKALRGKGEMLMGKNTLMRKAIKVRSETENSSDFDKQLFSKVVSDDNLVGNLGIIFTNENFSEIQQVIENNRIQAPARVGSISPLDVTIPAGNTGLEPGSTTFFQALGINTKIVKGSVEIVTEKKVLSTGVKVDNSTAMLLSKLKIKPFYYGLDLKYVYENGEIIESNILELKDDFFRSTIETSATNVKSLALALGIPTELTLPITMNEAFSNLLSLSLGSNYVFNEFNGAEVVEAIKSGKCLGGGAATSVAATSSVAAAAPVEEEEEEDDDMGFGLFD